MHFYTIQTQQVYHSPVTAASVVTPMSLARSSALIDVYALDTRSNALLRSFSIGIKQRCQQQLQLWAIWL